ncbi:MAG: hypothetical protein K0R84_957 [Clostridia bacterium]|jgi:hypothetical protein|nr:hypothetical protein [Clostridia bacterium]
MDKRLLENFSGGLFTVHPKNKADLLILSVPRHENKNI